MSSEVFIISANQGKDASEAIVRAVEASGMRPAKVEDALLAFEAGAPKVEAGRLAQEAGLVCTAVSLSSSLRAMFFATQSILSGDVQVNLVVGVGGEACAVVLAGSEAIGRWNLMPRARSAVRSLTGADTAMRVADIPAEEVAVMKDGDSIMRVKEALDELEQRQARWAMVRAHELALLMERI